ncbi:hypothetical protein BWR18_17150 [Tateyamaria omphalii]|uniref:Uncharacterized protein n=1 Tax=Tateyamaria omphalii TaxID=299262 RepID=A0A1P8MYY5_9RHOB|nr:hypothetical protein BWR18_17150 [Tateyamaria omphalii]
MLNQSVDGSGTTQRETAKAGLTEVGAKTHEVRRLNGKIFITDTNQLCIGLRKWLSAGWKERYAPHETSIAYAE